MSGTYGQMKLQMTDIISKSKQIWHRNRKKGHEKFMGMLDTIEIFYSVFQPIPKKKLLS